MNQKQFNLQPFSLSNSQFNGEVQAHLTLDGNKLTIHYQVFSDGEKIKIPPTVTQPNRQDNLWGTTCFEFFLGIVNSPVYWEFNLSPSGDWNVYRFSGYRQGMQPETAFSSLPFEFTRETDHLSLNISIDLEQMIQNSQQLELAITMVIEDKEGTITYWALKHPGSEADFHRRDSFVAI